jgi:hypothetical protein
VPASGADVDPIGAHATPKLVLRPDRRGLAPLRPKPSFTLIGHTKVCPELERPAVAITFFRPNIRGLSKCANPAAH